MIIYFHWFRVESRRYARVYSVAISRRSSFVFLSRQTRFKYSSRSITLLNWTSIWFWAARLLIFGSQLRRVPRSVWILRSSDLQAPIIMLDISFYCWVLSGFFFSNTRVGSNLAPNLSTVFRVSNAMCVKSGLFIIFSLVVKFSFIYGATHQECGTVEIRVYADVEQLRNCTSILGNLILTFQNDNNTVHGKLDNYTSEEVNDLTFPLRWHWNHFRLSISQIFAGKSQVLCWCGQWIS